MPDDAPQTTGRRRPRCTPQSYLEATVRYIRLEPPERQAELLGFLSEKERRQFEAEIARQEAEEAHVR